VLSLNDTAAFLKKYRDFTLTFPIENVPQLSGKNEHLTEVRKVLHYRGFRRVVPTPDYGTKCM
jgi:hypothetical protein